MIVCRANIVFLLLGVTDFWALEIVVTPWKPFSDLGNVFWGFECLSRAWKTFCQFWRCFMELGRRCICVDLGGRDDFFLARKAFLKLGLEGVPYMVGVS